MPVTHRDWNINREAVKALVAVYGPNEAARQAKLPRNTVMTWCRRYKWKKAARLPRTNGINGMPVEAYKDAGDAIRDAMANHKEVAEVNLAHYAARAATRAAKHKDPLAIARNVRDAAAVYRTVFPPEQGGEMVEGAILVGAALVRDNPVEMLATTEVSEIEDGRSEMGGGRSEIEDRSSEIGDREKPPSSIS